MRTAYVYTMETESADGKTLAPVFCKTTAPDDCEHPTLPIDVWFCGVQPDSPLISWLRDWAQDRKPTHVTLRKYNHLGECLALWRLTDVMLEVNWGELGATSDDTDIEITISQSS